MKTNAKKLAIALVAIAATLGACTKDNMIPVKPPVYSVNDNHPNASAVDQNMFEITMARGKWFVAGYNTGSPNMSKNDGNVFAGFTFTFNNDHVLIAEKEGKITSGRWTTFNENNRKLVALEFGYMPLNEMSGKWTMMTYNNTSVVLQSERTSGTASLKFEQLAPLPK